MTQNSAFKASVRARMEATGENYTTALRAIRTEREQQLPAQRQIDAPPLTEQDAHDVDAWRRVHFTAPNTGDDQENADG